MNTPELPPLPNGVECLTADGAEVRPYEDGGLNLQCLIARYKVHGLNVTIGWVIGHPMGSFREPNTLTVDFDSFAYAVTGENADVIEPREPFDGITTSLLRSIPMAHARALMREQYEQLSVTGVRRAIMPLPSRVETERDYVHVATAYVDLVKVSVEPIKRLSDWTGESVDTWSARLRRARAKGILEGKGRTARIADSYITMSYQIRDSVREHKGA